ncbi:hypothetical protein BX589_10817 [Paraburkholderia fungorum]|jgi:hypothetical protein|nr:hypothetical protein BX589_10817 [Paraburkholderia fungorum]
MTDPRSFDPLQVHTVTAPWQVNAGQDWRVVDRIRIACSRLPTPGDVEAVAEIVTAHAARTAILVASLTGPTLPALEEHTARFAIAAVAVALVFLARISFTVELVTQRNQAVFVRLSVGWLGHFSAFERGRPSPSGRSPDWQHVDPAFPRVARSGTLACSASNTRSGSTGMANAVAVACRCRSLRRFARACEAHAGLPV